MRKSLLLLLFLGGGIASALAVNTPSAPVTKNPNTNVLNGNLVIGPGSTISVSGGTATGFGGSWGSISGTLSSQTDLMNALAAKEEALTFSTGVTRTTNTITVAADAGLPSQTGQSGKYLTTNGTSSSWGTVVAPVWGSITGTLASQSDLATALGALVPKTTTINGHALSGNFSLTSSDLSLGDAALLNVGTGSGYVAAGNAPAAAVTAHEGTYAHANLPSTAEKAALAGTVGTPSGSNKFVTTTDGRVNIVFDAVASYNASGCGTTTTGSVSASSPTLTVGSAITFAQGQGILIKGAGAQDRTVSNGVLNSTTTVTSSTIAFVSADVGKVITGTGIPANTTIVSLNSATSAVMSQAATASASSVTLAIWRNHVSTISAISGTTITIAASATTTVSGALVQHDDTDAINAAIAAAFNAGGGRVLLTKRGTADGTGVYRCNKGWDATTNSIITFPQSGDVAQHFNTMYLRIEGEVSGRPNTYLTGPESGVVIDATDAPIASGTLPSVIGVGNPTLTPTATTPASGWNLVYPQLDSFAIYAPANPSFGGICAKNAPGLLIGDSMRLLALKSAGSWVAGTYTQSVGIVFPYVGNAAYMILGAVRIQGFRDGVWCSEHMRFGSPMVQYASNTAYRFKDGGHNIHGFLKAESCAYYITVTSSNAVPVDLSFQGENNGLGGGWSALVAGIYDPSNLLRGSIRYTLVSGNYSSAMPLNGAKKVRLENLREVRSPSGKVAAYAFSDLNDAGLFGYNLTGTGTPTFATGKVGNGMVLNGTSQYATVALETNSRGILTVAGWFKIDALPTTGNRMVLCSQWFNGGGWLFQVMDDGTLRLRAGNGGTPQNLVTTSTVTTDTWYFAAAEINTEQQTMRIAIDNGPWVSVALTGVTSPADLPLVFGRADDYGVYHYLDGMLDEWVIYNRALSAQEYDWLYNAGSGRSVVE